MLSFLGQDILAVPRAVSTVLDTRQNEGPEREVAVYRRTRGPTGLPHLLGPPLLVLLVALVEFITVRDL